MKKIYIQPETEQIQLNIESLLNTDTKGWLTSDDIGANKVTMTFDDEDNGSDDNSPYALWDEE